MISKEELNKVYSQFNDELSKFLAGMSCKNDKKEQSMISEFAEWKENQEPTPGQMKSFCEEKFGHQIGPFALSLFNELLSLNKRLEILENEEKEDAS